MIRTLLVSITLILVISTNISSQSITIHYLGHSAFILKFDDINVVTDYGKPNAWKQWGWDSPISGIGDLVPNIMIYSHLHEDHYDSTRIPNEVDFILKNGEGLVYKDLVISSIPSCEDQFGDFNNTSYLFSYKGYKILHTGDIQTMIANIENDTIAEYFTSNYPKNIDVLIMPIEGKIKYIKETYQFIKLLQPKNIIPTHYWSIDYLNEFIDFIETAYNSSFLYEIYRYDQSEIDLNGEDEFRVIILNRTSNE